MTILTNLSVEEDLKIDLLKVVGVEELDPPLLVPEDHQLVYILQGSVNNEPVLVPTTCSNSWK